jgi:hypothetical protein
MLRIVFLLFLSFCSVPRPLAGFGLDSLAARDVRAAAPATPAAPSGSAANGLKEWTIMVFMNGNSNIEPYALADINRFETAGSGEKVNIIAELGRPRGLDNDTAADGDWSGSRRYYIVKDGDKEHISSPVLMDLGKTDMGDYREVVSFMKWAKAAYPAKRYMLIIWDHGWGWIDPKKPAGGSKSISHDFTTGSYIKTTDLGKIFAEGGRVDLYASMACFMQMAEVAYELKDAADVIVGSEEVVQLPSFNFEDFFAYMLRRPETSAELAGANMAETFRELYSRPENAEMLEKNKYGVQLSAIRSAPLPALALKVRNWSGLAMRVNDAAACGKAKAGVLRFEVGDETTDPDKQISFYGDLSRFIELVNTNLDMTLSGAVELKAAGEDLRKFIESELTIKNVFLGKDRTGKDYSGARGLAIDIPGKPGSLIDYYPSYSELAFEKAAGWHRFMDYLEKIN